MSKLFYVVVIAVFFSCNTDVKDATRQKETDVADRKLFVDELRKLHAAFLASDSMALADFIPFPFKDSVAGNWIDDSGLGQELSRNGNVLTKDIFLKHYSVITEKLMIKEIHPVLKLADIDLLLKRDTIDYEIRPASSPCIQFYHIDVENDIAHIAYGYSRYANAAEDNDEEATAKPDGCYQTIELRLRYRNGRCLIIP